MKKFNLIIALALTFISLNLSAQMVADAREAIVTVQDTDEVLGCYTITSDLIIRISYDGNTVIMSKPFNGTGEYTFDLEFLNLPIGQRIHVQPLLYGQVIEACQEWDTEILLMDGSGTWDVDTTVDFLIFSGPDPHN